MEKFFHDVELKINRLLLNMPADKIEAIQAVLDAKHKIKTAQEKMHKP